MVNVSPALMVKSPVSSRIGPVYRGPSAGVTVYASGLPPERSGASPGHWMASSGSFQRRTRSSSGA
mgnify:CR=1 FL=1